MNKTRTARDDGAETRLRILRTAGNLFAERGYYAVMSKDICRAAGVNTAAVNYHFGGRDELYKEVLRLVHKQILTLDFLTGLKTCEPKEALERYFDRFAENMWYGKSWEALVWAREILTPSPFSMEILKEVALPKGLVAVELLAAYLGRKMDDPVLYSTFFSMMAPFAAFFLGSSRKNMDYQGLLPVKYPKEELLPNLKKFAFAGLDVFRAE